MNRRSSPKSLILAAILLSVAGLLALPMLDLSMSSLAGYAAFWAICVAVFLGPFALYFLSCCDLQRPLPRLERWCGSLVLAFLFTGASCVLTCPAALYSSGVYERMNRCHEVRKIEEQRILADRPSDASWDLQVGECKRIRHYLLGSGLGLSDP